MKSKYILIILAGLITLVSCKEQLEIKPSKTLAVPETLEDLQAILNNTNIMTPSWPYAVQAASDDGYVSFEDWNVASLTEKNTYIWEQDVFNDYAQNDWSLPYTGVFYANVVLEGVEEHMPAGAPAAWLDVKGQALFYRAYAFYHLAQVFARPYLAATAGSDPGIPLRLSADLNEKSTRASVEESYERILEDLKASLGLLNAAGTYKTRPSKAAAYGMLARVYLSMENYGQAGLYADSCLQMNGQLLDYNQLDSTAYSPLARFNKEVIFHSSLFPVGLLLPEMYRVEPELYELYGENDLRRPMFYKKGENVDDYFFYGSYDGSVIQFNGLATDEMYLIKAESFARENRKEDAMGVLNSLLQMRWKAGTFVELVAADAEDALELVLLERRKELAFRGLRWTDLRRLNRDARFAVTIRRVLDGKEYVLGPGDKRYVFPIPLEVIEKTGMEQNER